MPWTKSELILNISNKNMPFQEFQFQSTWKHKNKKGKTSSKRPRRTIYLQHPTTLSTSPKAELPVSTIENGTSLLLWDLGKQILEELPTGTPIPPPGIVQYSLWHGVAERCFHHSPLPHVCSHFGNLLYKPLIVGPS